MLGWLLRFTLLKVLPRKIIPLITLIEIVRLAWGLRRRRYAVNEPWRSRTGPPPWPARSSSEPRRRR